MADISIRGLSKVYPNGVVAVRDVRPRRRRRRVPRTRRPVRLRQVDAAADDRRARGGDRRRRCSIGGRDITDAQPRERDIAMVFQSYALYPHMTVRKNIGYPLKLAGVPAEEIERACRRGRRARCSSRRCSTASPGSCRAASASGWRWAGRSSASRRRS